MKFFKKICCAILAPPMNRPLFLTLCAIIFLGFGCGPKPSSDSTSEMPVIDRAAILFEAKQNGLIMTDEEKIKMADPSRLKTVQDSSPTDTATYAKKDFSGWKSAALADVTGGESFGLAFSRYTKGQYTIVGQLGNLPEPQTGYVYEGWLIRRGENMSVVHVGVAHAVESGHGLVFLSNEDLSDHDFFVLTLEPDDLNSNPAEHILEGTLN